MKDINFIQEKDSLFFKKINSKKDITENDSIDGYLIDSDENEARKIIEFLKNKNILIAVQGKDDIFNRRALETLKINFLVSPETGERKDTLKQRDSGLNHVLAKIAGKNNISLLLDFSDIKSIEDKKQKALRISRIMQNIKICRKAKCKIKIASLADKKENISGELERKSFLFSLGASSQQVKESCEF